MSAISCQDCSFLRNLKVMYFFLCSVCEKVIGIKIVLFSNYLFISPSLQWTLVYRQIIQYCTWTTFISIYAQTIAHGYIRTNIPP